MRRIGTIADREDAERFRDFLLTQDIQSQVEAAGDQWAIWVYEEDKVDATKAELETYRQNPREQRYQEAIAAADRIRHEKAKQEIAARRKHFNMARRWNRPLVRQIPVTFTLVVLSVVVTLGTRFGANLEAFGGQIPIVEGMKREGDLTSFPTNFRQLPGVAQGEVWRLVTPAFLHFDPLHLFVDMYVLVLLGGMLERIRGSRAMLGLFLLTAVAGNLTELLLVGPAFGGMSGVNAGIFGYMWIRGQMEPESGLALPPNLVFIMIAFLVFAAIGFVGEIANGAHFGGLASGMAAAAIGAWLRRLKLMT